LKVEKGEPFRSPLFLFYGWGVKLTNVQSAVTVSDLAAGSGSWFDAFDVEGIACYHPSADDPYLLILISSGSILVIELVGRIVSSLEHAVVALSHDDARDRLPGRLLSAPQIR